MTEPKIGLRGSKSSPGPKGKEPQRITSVRKAGTSMVRFGKTGSRVAVDTKRIARGSQVYEDGSSKGGRINASTGRNTSSLPGVTAKTVTKQLNKSAKSAMASSAGKATRAK